MHNRTFVLKMNVMQLGLTAVSVDLGLQDHLVQSLASKYVA